MKSVSPLAQEVHGGMRTAFKNDKGVTSKLVERTKVEGIVVHTSGSSIVEDAVKAKVDVFEYVVNYYMQPTHYFPHYVGDYDKDLVQVCDEMLIAYHAAWSKEHLPLIKNGTWVEEMSSSNYMRWEGPWQGWDPWSLSFFQSPNAVFIGIELPPLLKPKKGSNLLYTDQQHDLVAELASDIFARHGLVPSRRRLMGHEDLNVFTGEHGRWDKGGGWDPGSRRDVPRWDWDRVYKKLGL